MATVAAFKGSVLHLQVRMAKVRALGLYIVWSRSS